MGAAQPGHGDRSGSEALRSWGEQVAGGVALAAAALSGLAAVDDVDDLTAAAAPSHVPGWFTPDVALLQLAFTALNLACLAGAEPPEYEGLRERYLPGVRIRGRVEHRNSQYAPYPAT